MIEAKDAVVWVNTETHEVMVKAFDWGIPRDAAGYRRKHWRDPIGAAYSDWRKMKNSERVRLMLETAIEFAMDGIPMPEILRAFAEVREFKALGGESLPMCRALTTVLVGKCLEPNTMSFEELLVNYAA